MNLIPQIDAQFIEKHTDFSKLIEELQKAFFFNSVIVPQRHHHDFPNPKMNAMSTLLLMPAWEPSEVAGVKIVTVSPENHQFQLPSIQGSYLYINAVDGSVKAILEAKTLTAKRTAAASALASKYLSKKDASSLLMIGTGALSVNLIKAHASVRPITAVYIWGRNYDKTKAIAKKLNSEKFNVQPIKNISDKISEVDIISCATLSKKPLIFGKYLKDGQHLDLVGAYKNDMREADDDCIVKSSIFIDTSHGIYESGDIAIPLTEGLISENDIQANLFDLASNKSLGRKSEKEITLFKSVGHALEDLTAAKYYYKQYNLTK